MGRVRVTSNVIPWSVKKSQDFDATVLEMATDIDRIAKVIAPKASRALVNSARIVRRGVASYRVIFGGGPVRYARRRHFENKKTPSSLRYLQRAGDSVRDNRQRYLRNI